MYTYIYTYIYIYIFIYVHMYLYVPYVYVYIYNVSARYVCNVSQYIAESNYVHFGIGSVQLALCQWMLIPN